MKSSPTPSFRNFKNLVLASGFLLVGAGLSASAAASITAVGASADLGTMPGSATDFTLFGNPNQFPTVLADGGTGLQPTVLNDFTVAAGTGGSNIYGGNGNYSTIDAPAGSGDTSVVTGIIFRYTSTPDLVDFTLGTAGSTFNFSDFNVYLMYGNAHDGYEIDTSLVLTLLPPASSSDQTPLSTVTFPVTDDNSSLTEATFQEFEVTGAAAGDVLQVGADGFGYLGGASFSEVPEPQTYALLGLGVLALGFVRTKLKLR